MGGYRTPRLPGPIAILDRSVGGSGGGGGDGSSAGGGESRPYVVRWGDTSGNGKENLDKTVIATAKLTRYANLGDAAGRSRVSVERRKRRSCQ